jgi:hypothetical protein
MGIEDKPKKSSKRSLDFSPEVPPLDGSVEVIGFLKGNYLLIFIVINHIS